MTTPTQVNPLVVMKRGARRYAVGSRASQEMRDAAAAVAALVAAAKEVTEAPILSLEEIKAMARLIITLIPFTTEES